MSFRMRRGRASLSVGSRGPRASYRLGCLLPGALLVAGVIAACGSSGVAPTLVPFVPGPTLPGVEATPDPEPDPTAKPLPMTKVDGAGSVRRGGTATVTIETTKGADCSINVQYESGSGTAKGLDDKTANSEGRVKWSWTVGTNTTKGEVPIWIFCTKGERSGDLDLTMTVT